MSSKEMCIFRQFLLLGLTNILWADNHSVIYYYQHVAVKMLFTICQRGVFATLHDA